MNQSGRRFLGLMAVRHHGVEHCGNTAAGVASFLLDQSDCLRSCGPLASSRDAQQVANFAKSRRAPDTGQGGSVGTSSDIDVAAHEEPMQKAVQHLQATLRGLQTGRASPGILDVVKIEAYGDWVPLKGVASVSVRDRQTLAVSAYDESIIGAIEKGIRLSNLNLNPSVEESEVLVHIPRLTKETVAAMNKLVKKEGESAKVSIRNVRRDIMDAAKKVASSDEKKRLEKQAQAMTDKFIREIDAVVCKKEDELSTAL